MKNYKDHCAGGDPPKYAFSYRDGILLLTPASIATFRVTLLGLAIRSPPSQAGASHLCISSFAKFLRRCQRHDRGFREE